MKSNAKASKRIEDSKKDEAQQSVDGSFVEAQMSPVTQTQADVSSNQDEEQVPVGMMHPLPKRPTTSYFFFMNENHAKLRESRYDGKTDKVDICDIAVELGNRWQLLSDTDKKKYNDMYEKDKLRYQSQLQEIKDNGFFVMEDGKKSNQVLVPVPAHKLAKKVATKSRSTQTGKEWLQDQLAEMLSSKVQKLEQQMQRQVRI